MFQLTPQEWATLKSQIVISNAPGRGGRRTAPYAFTQEGVAMLSGVLNSARAIAVNVQIMRTFVRLRQMLATHADLARKLTDLEKKYDKQFAVVFDAIRQFDGAARATGQTANRFPLRGTQCQIQSEDDG